MKFYKQVNRKARRLNAEIKEQKQAIILALKEHSTPEEVFLRQINKQPSIISKLN